MEIFIIFAWLWNKDLSWYFWTIWQERFCQAKKFIHLYILSSSKTTQNSCVDLKMSWDWEKNIVPKIKNSILKALLPSTQHRLWNLTLSLIYYSWSPDKSRSNNYVHSWSLVWCPNTANCPPHKFPTEIFGEHCQSLFWNLGQRFQKTLTTQDGTCGYKVRVVLRIQC